MPAELLLLTVMPGDKATGLSGSREFTKFFQRSQDMPQYHHSLKVRPV